MSQLLLHEKCTTYLYTKNAPLTITLKVSQLLLHQKCTTYLYIKNAPLIITLKVSHLSLHEKCAGLCSECLPNGVASCTNTRCLVEASLLQQLGGDQAGTYPNRWGWQATNYTIFWGRKLEEGVLHRTGTEHTDVNLNPIFLDYNPATIPPEFDARAKWRQRISRVRDQGWCGSSWAFSTITVATDRLAIESEGLEAVPLSPQNLISCDRRVQQGCEGGKIERAWQYLRRYGQVYPQKYNSVLTAMSDRERIFSSTKTVVDETCYPYTSGTSFVKDICKIPRRSSFLTVQCDSPAHQAVGRESLYKMEPAYRIRSRESDIQYEIMTNGPVQARMRVEQDFFSYMSGVYSSSGLSDPSVVGHHSVRLIGWGEQYSDYERRPVKYWLAANSWGEDWGERGLFKIRRGVNESGIEENILAVRAGLLTQYPSNLIADAQSEWFYI
ncbi:hypothetical protein HAZT_HAZT003621 [Hyalella azteca]|uniref:Peptidase C1A papain C-terminal domain-containing protein n=1 Tax=Hyalella azteca TaxID=294128 RepID=A0A6A0GU39_HYAAZ|nr:hypothetical protein HAZT_HAZT003621 [Hyalella azteca]